MARHSNRIKQKLKQRKQKDMRASPETLFCDFGQAYGKLENYSGEGYISDMHFYTERSQLWREKIKEYFPNSKEARNSQDGTQIIISQGSDIKDMTLYLYKTGICLVQGNNFMDWAQHFDSVRRLVEGERLENANLSVTFRFLMKDQMKYGLILVHIKIGTQPMTVIWII